MIYINNKVIVGIVVIVLLTIGGIYSIQYSNQTSINVGDIQLDSSQLESYDPLVLNNENNTTENALYSMSSADTNVIQADNNSTLNVSNSIINKSGDTEDAGSDNCDFYGINSAVLTKNGATTCIENSIIYTNATGANAVFSSNYNSVDSQNSGMGGTPPEAMNHESGSPPDGTNPEQKENPDSMDSSASNETTTINVTNTKIETYKDKSRGLDATFGGIINAENVYINTRGSSCAALATDRGEGNVSVTNSMINTGVDNQSGKGSPLIYSTGNIITNNTSGTAYNSQIACIEGKNSITMNNCDYTCYATGNREDNGKYVDLGGIFIYQSMSGDADVGTSIFNATNTKLSIDSSSEYYSTAPMIHTTNTKSNIILDSCELNFGSNILLEASGQNQWGSVGSNGASVEFNTHNQKLDGDIIVDSISSLNFNMDKTDYTGVINSNDSFGSTNVTISTDSTWTLSDDSYITSLENNGSIEYGDYTLYVDGKKYNKDNPYV